MILDTPVLGHKAIGCHYLWSGFLFLLLGIIGTAILKLLYHPVAFDDASEPYDFFMAAHGTVLVFFGIVPLLFSGFGNYVMPLAPGSEMRFPRLNFISLVLFYLSSGFLVIGLIIRSQSTLNVAVGLILFSTLFCCVNFVTSILWLHKSGLTLSKMSPMVLTLFITAPLIFINFILLEVAVIMQFLHGLQELQGSSLTSPLSSHGDIPTLWHHVFWFMGHPEVYILLLFVLGLVAEGFKTFFKRVSFTA